METLMALLDNPAATALLGTFFGALAGVVGPWLASRAANRRARWELGVRAALAEWEMHIEKKLWRFVSPPSVYVAVTARLVDQLLAYRRPTVDRVTRLIREADELTDALLEQKNAAARARKDAQQSTEDRPTTSG